MNIVIFICMVTLFFICSAAMVTLFLILTEIASVSHCGYIKILIF